MKIVDNLDRIHKNEFKIERSMVPEVNKDNTTSLDFHLQSSESSDYLVDTILVQGVSVDRAQNDSNYDYHIDPQREH